MEAQLHSAPAANTEAVPSQAPARTQTLGNTTDSTPTPSVTKHSPNLLLDTYAGSHEQLLAHGTQSPEHINETEGDSLTSLHREAHGDAQMQQQQRQGLSVSHSVGPEYGAVALDSWITLDPDSPVWGSRISLR